MPSTPSLKQIMQDTLAAVQSIDVKVDTLIAGQGADSANIQAIADAQVIREQLQRIQIDTDVLDYSGRYGADAEINALDSDADAVPTQVPPPAP